MMKKCEKIAIFNSLFLGAFSILRIIDLLPKTDLVCDLQNISRQQSKILYLIVEEDQIGINELQLLSDLSNDILDQIKRIKPLKKMKKPKK